ncbi:hypothetical protein FACS1894182_01030 [Bacteroidia bacterium]|nr:hypothetical protein FACS1894182_01030 [Bacteroidia bacterium]
MKTVKIGRTADNDIRLDNDRVSRNHCTITQDDNGKYSLEDHSTNGTKVNGKVIKRAKTPLRFDSVVFVEGIKLPWLSYFKNKKEDDAPMPVQATPLTPEPVIIQQEVLPEIEIDLYDLATDSAAEYGTLQQSILLPLNDYKTKLDAQRKTVYHSFSDELLSLAVESYNQSFAVLSEVFEKASRDSMEIHAKFDKDIQLLENLRIQKMVIEPMQHKQVDASEIYAIEQRKTAIAKQFAEVKNEVRGLLSEISDNFLQKHPLLFPNQYETAEANNNVWEKLEQRKSTPCSTLFAGKIAIVFTLFDEKFTIHKNDYLRLLNTQNVICRYNSAAKQKCFNFVNTLAGRLLAASAFGLFSVGMIDTEDMNGTCNTFKQLNKKIFGIYSREEEIVKLLEETVRHIENVIQNVLHGTIHSLADHNLGKENKEGYRLLVIKDFPTGISARAAGLLKKILKNGMRAGVNVLLLVDEDEINRTEESAKIYDSFNIDSIENESAVYDFLKTKTIQFENFNNEQLIEIVQHTNKGSEGEKEKILKLTDYLIPQTEWWSRRSANFIEIPFGIAANLQIQTLAITQESGQNSAIVIGIPGSGKSVFLHSIICNAVTNYSPDELELYLMDFSGVEFNTYALHNLPHAKVIAPEAEREFGLSVLRELKEEGSRRMELCRNNEVGNIVDLREKNPNIKAPRQLVIIDEFQKLFEIQNDKISQEAEAIIEIIIREFRKFGINIILASQTLKGSPLDMSMIANRVVFKYSPYDQTKLFEGNYPDIKNTGECAYNARSGAKDANISVQTFFISQRERDTHLENITIFSDSHSFGRKKQIVFRSDDLREFRLRRKEPKYAHLQTNPTEIGIYLGENIAIADCDLCAEFRKQSGDNLIVIGGEQDVAQKIAIYASMSMMDMHKDNTAQFCFFNFMEQSDPQAALPADYFSAANFDMDFPATAEEVTVCLTDIVNDINARKTNYSNTTSNIYLSFYAFQRAQMFKKVNDYNLSEEGKLLDYILKNGPLVGVYTVLQIDKLDNLKRALDSPLANFSHRIALQMDENASQSITNSSAASKLFVMNRPSSKYRAYYYNNDRNILAKFKPYK